MKKSVNCAPGMSIKGRKRAKKRGGRQVPFPHEHSAMAARTGVGVTDQPQGGQSVQTGPGIS